MGIAINTGFDLGAGVSIDSRFILTKAEMLTMNDNIMPDVYPAWDADTGDQYIYKKTNSPSPITGKFAKVEGGASSDDAVKFASTIPAADASNVGHAILYTGETNATYSKGHVYLNTPGSAVEITTVAQFVSYLNNYGLSANLLEYSPEAQVEHPTKTLIVNGVQYYIGLGESGIYSFTNPGELITTIDYENLRIEKLNDEAVAALGLNLPEGYSWTDVSPVTQVTTLPAASAALEGKVYQYVGDTTGNYTLGHFYRCTYVTVSGGDPAYEWQELDTENDDNYVEHFSVMPEPGSTYEGHVVQYYGTDTENFKCGHFYKCVSDGQNPAKYAWEGVDTETDTYDAIEARPLILTRAEELSAGNITIADAETSSVTLTGVTLTAGAKYEVTIKGVPEQATAVENSGNISLTVDTLHAVITTASGEENSVLVYTRQDETPGTEISYTLSTVPYVTVNPDYVDFFNEIGAESTLAEDVTANIDIGAITAGTKLDSGTSFTEVIKALLIKYFAPTITMSSDKALLNKKGTTITKPIEISATSVKRSYDITSTIVKNPEGTIIASDTTAVGGTVTATWETDISTDTTFSASVTDGKTPVNATIKFEFINPYYYGNSDTATVENFTGLSEELVKKATSKNAAFTASNKYLVFAYDASYGNLTSIKDQNNFENLNSWTKSVVTVGGENYNVYVTNTTITCRAFTYTFKI